MRETLSHNHSNSWIFFVFFIKVLFVLKFSLKILKCLSLILVIVQTYKALLSYVIHLFIKLCLYNISNRSKQIPNMIVIFSNWIKLILHHKNL